VSGSAGLEPDGAPEILLSVLGAIRLDVGDRGVPIASGGKTERLLTCLALRRRRRMPRSEVLEWLWPGGDPSASAQSLNSLTHHLNKAVASLAGGVPLVVQASGFYRLNPADAVAVDVDLFDDWRQRGQRLLRAGNEAGVAWCVRAVELYRGELCAGTRMDVMSERERLRASQLDLLAHLADHFVEQDESATALAYIRRLLSLDSCREDAHRQAMRCYVRLGQRSQALRQFRLCCEALAREFDAVPEAETVAMFDAIRRSPAGSTAHA